MTIEFDLEPKPLKKKADVATLIENDNDGKENDKVVCHRCTNTFFQIYFTGNDNDDTNNAENDPITQDILDKKVYMKPDMVHNCYRCRSCGNIELMRDIQIVQPEKKLIAKGISSYPEYHKVTGSKGDFLQGVLPKHKNRIDILY